jgi:hypothetical protein
MAERRVGADELEQLQRWGAGLREDQRPEVAAAGKAILLLIEEIEHLHVLIWDRLLYPDLNPPEAEGERGPDSLPASLLVRLRGVVRRSRRETAPQPDPTAEAGFHSSSTGSVDECDP